MPNLSAKPQGRPRRAGAGYEKRDANAKWIFGIVAFLLVSGLIMHFVLAGVMERLRKTAYPTDELNGTRRGLQTRAQANNAPHLQLMPPEELKEFRAKEEAELNSYGWINHTAGVVRIPVNRAMDLLLQRGLPARTGTNAIETGVSEYELQQQRPQTGQSEIKERP
jgi:hypothetical protein